MATRDILSKSSIHKLEPDLFDYVVSMIEDNDNKLSEEICEAINGFLVSSDVCNEKEAAGICADLISKLSLNSTPEPPTTETKVLAPTPPVKPVSLSVPLVVPIIIKKNDANSLTPQIVPNTDSIDDLDTNLPVKEKKEKREKKTKASKKPTPSELDESRAQEIENELEQASMTAAIERSKNGAFNGALEANSFTLPNPGNRMYSIEYSIFTQVTTRIQTLIKFFILQYL